MRVLYIAGLGAAIALCSCRSLSLTDDPTPANRPLFDPATAHATFATVTKVVDGDTIEVILGTT